MEKTYLVFFSAGFSKNGYFAAKSCETKDTMADVVARGYCIAQELGTFYYIPLANIYYIQEEEEEEEEE